MTKDLLVTLQKVQKREPNFDPDDDLSFIMLQSSMGCQLDKFLAKVTEIQTMILAMESNVERMREIQSAILCAPSASSFPGNQNKKLNQNLDHVTSILKTVAKQVRCHLEKIEQEIEKVEEEERNPKCSINFRVRALHHASLTTQFVQIMLVFNQTESDFRDRCKSKVQRQLEIEQKRSITEEELTTVMMMKENEKLCENSSVGFCVPNIFVTQESQLTPLALADMESRHEDILKLERSTQELHDLVMDTALLVETQGNVIQRTGLNIEIALDHVCQGEQNIGWAGEYKRKRKRKKIMICVVLCGVVVVLVILVYLGF